MDTLGSEVLNIERSSVVTVADVTRVGRHDLVVGDGNYLAYLAFQANETALEMCGVAFQVIKGRGRRGLKELERVRLCVPKKGRGLLFS